MAELLINNTVGTGGQRAACYCFNQGVLSADIKNDLVSTLDGFSLV